MFFFLWIGGNAAFWVGVLAAEISGYPLQTAPSVAVAMLLAFGQGLLLWRLQWGRSLLGGLVLGLVPAYLGFHLQSGHWVSEVLILGLVLSLASHNALLAQKWRQELWQNAGSEELHHLVHPRQALLYTLVNILMIGGLLLIWYMPAAPLPARKGVWLLAAVAVLNQEGIKRKWYATVKGIGALAIGATTFQVGLYLWLLLVLSLRLWGQG
ncbi:hypothetical protein [Desulfobacca acetoxidans]|uniref:Uncharacterized protein n=1 Tax=Desulfobacca acetoxidans (strain ATCC 700848 / DSM 11109 / ASRB2) TaxID=880072 RepID=F2NE47_DESAR|nr:hypothetical protein [Desulfobacca acetoxidans]AEB10677.1 hypothetical protein Desac_2877 [Desulfobacca acetoxidans DSM 11109]